MHPRFSSLCRALYPFSSSSTLTLMVRVTPRTTPFRLKALSDATYHFSHRSHLAFVASYSCPSSSPVNSALFGGRFHGVRAREDWGFSRRIGPVFAAERGYRRVRRRPAKKKEKELELNVNICIEEQLPDDPEILNIAEMLRLNVPMAMKLAFDSIKDSKYKTRDTTINDIGGFENVELSLLLCNDEFIRKLNIDWRDEDHATDVLSMSQHIPELKLPILMLGDIVISVETAARQAQERGHTLLDEIRILMVHGLLHLLGFDHEISNETEAEMEEAEELLLKSLGWKGKGLIQYANDSETNGNLHTEDLGDRKKDGSLRFYKPKFKYIFCDMDGTLLNSKSQITSTTAKALIEARSRGIKVVIATGKSRPGAINTLKMVDLAGKDGIVSELSPGVFLQGLLLYGRQGREIFRRNLDQNVCRKKLIFLDTSEGVSTTLRPYWSEATGDRARVVQAVPDMLEVVPVGTSKGSGVRVLLDHLGVTAEEVMAIGDGENDIEMLELASLGVALSNGSDKAKAVANVIGASNDDDGVADAIYRYAF
ncbi:endoribonuclease YBEY, chloroplastic isoform X2 [Malania oleifera]|uniref:endoribonuclease YBEY, chloroplastic isoform X2 n=1 Tax=Malania oleifera TaxID=397392 RepID=UPI0025ADBF71|nr:endoribonuclease YBEY, chloroplastic isoform X2 [Malania oleifera]